MPMVTIQMKKGRSENQLRRLAKRITDAVVEEAGASPAGVWIAFEEIEADRFFAGYKTLGDYDREKRNEVKA